MLVLKKDLRQILTTLHTVFASWRYRFIAAGAAASFLCISILIPAFLIPSNTIAMVLSMLHIGNYIVLFLLAASAGVLVALNIYRFHLDRISATHAGGAGFSTVASLLGGTLLTSCHCGLGFVIGILGLGAGSASFLIEQQLWFTLGALLIALIGLYFSARKPLGVC